MRLGSARAPQGSRRRAGGRLRRAVDPEGRRAEGRGEGDPHRPRSALRALSAARLPHRPRAHRRASRRRCEALWRSAQKQAPSPRTIEERRKTVTKQSQPKSEERRAAASSRCRRRITGKWLSACMNKLLDERHAPRQRVPDGARGDADHASPAATSATPSAGGLGWGMGAALGAKLASPDKTVICALGDGAYMFGNPTAGALRVRSDAAAGALHHREQRALGGGAPLDALDLSEGIRRGDERSRPSPRSSPRRASSTSIQASGGHGERVDASRKTSCRRSSAR